jgi:peptidoglycan/LPS O-acetylase OafA/YrhL
MKQISTLSFEDKNNFDAVRLGLALIVVFSHVLALTGSLSFNFLALFNADFAVKGFFSISGFLVMRSYISSGSLFEFFEKRSRRIYPAYIAVIFLCFFIGMFMTSLDLITFLRCKDTWRYLLSNIVFLNFIQSTLPALFDSNSVQAVNGALWTIKVEVCLYFCIPLIFYSFNKVGSFKSTVLIVLFSCFWVLFFKLHFSPSYGAEIARQFPGQLSYFTLGAFFSVNATALSRVRLLMIISSILFIFFVNFELNIFIEPIFYTSLVVFLATSAFANLHLGRFGDISYGVYLLHFPIIQSLIYLKVFSFNPYIGLVLTLVMTILMAFLSWHLIEKSFLKRSSYYVVSADA